MDKKQEKSKIYRILALYERLNNCEVKNKWNFAEKYEVNEKLIQRDINELKSYLEQEEKKKRTIVNSGSKKGYEMINKAGFKFVDRNIFELSKIILESRAFLKQEMDRILDILKLVLIHQQNNYACKIVLHMANGEFR